MYCVVLDTPGTITEVDIHVHVHVRVGMCTGVLCRYRVSS